MRKSSNLTVWAVFLFGLPRTFRSPEATHRESLRVSLGHCVVSEVSSTPLFRLWSAPAPRYQIRSVAKRSLCVLRFVSGFRWLKCLSFVKRSSPVENYKDAEHIVCKVQLTFAVTFKVSVLHQFGYSFSCPFGHIIVYPRINHWISKSVDFTCKLCYLFSSAEICSFITLSSCFCVYFIIS